jgi:hypothetical protein
MLRLNCKAGKKMPVRVIRGPKLGSKWGTANSGGGYRYDGLYEVVSAEMVKGKAKGSLLTAVFELSRLEGQDRGQEYEYRALPLAETAGGASSALLASGSADGVAGNQGEPRQKKRKARA